MRPQALGLDTSREMSSFVRRFSERAVDKKPQMT